jgi:hypothetical protein
MPAGDKRDVLQIVASDVGRGGVTRAMLRAARRRIRDAGGELAVWGVLREDVYESKFGDGVYLHLRGVALNRQDAERLAALGDGSGMTRWSIRLYQLGLERGEPVLTTKWRDDEEFSINDLVRILAEIPHDGTTSLLMTGAGVDGRRSGPHMRILK